MRAWQAADGGGDGGRPADRSGAGPLDRLQWTTVLYDLHETNPDNGLVRDKTDSTSPSSIAAVGLALASLPVTAERGVISRPFAAKIARRRLRGSFQLHRKTRRDRMRAKLKGIKAELRRRMHQPIPNQGQWLKQVVTGHFAYYAVPTNSRALAAFRHYVTDLWRRALRRRSQKDGFTWERMTKLADDWLPQPHILHPWPDVRFDVKHPR